MSNVIFFDIDDTIINGQSQPRLVKYLFFKGKINILFLIRVYFWFILYKLSLIKSPLSIMEYSFRFISGWRIDLTEKILNEFYNDNLKVKLNRKVIDEINYHKKQGNIIIIVTNVFYSLAKIIADNLGIDKVIATNLEIENNRYTGKIKGEIVYGENKVRQSKK